MKNPILLKAAEIIEEHGWGQGNYRDETTGCYCVMGALWEADIAVTGGQRENTLWDKETSLLRRYLGQVNLVRWNDELDPEVGKNVVVAALRAAAMLDEEVKGPGKHL